MYSTTQNWFTMILSRGKSLIFKDKTLVLLDGRKCGVLLAEEKKEGKMFFSRTDRSVDSCVHGSSGHTVF